MQDTRAQIEQILKAKFHPLRLDLEDESGRHAGHAGARGGGGHYRLSMVSEEFHALGLVERHRLVNEALRDLFPHQIHALALELKAPGE